MQDYRLSKMHNQQLVGSFELKKIRKNPPVRAANNHSSDGLLTASVFDLRLMLVRRLDREEMPVYNLTVEAIDGGELTGKVVVVIKVKDVNDNIPEFEKDSYVAEVRENVPLNTTIVVVQASDRDADLNAKIVYKLESYDGTSEEFKEEKQLGGSKKKDYIGTRSQREALQTSRKKESSRNNGYETAKKLSVREAFGEVPFEINNETGRVYTSAHIDFEQCSLYKLAVVAQDLGPHSVPAKVALVISILDQNDNAPHITIDTLSTTEAEAEVAENMRAGTFVAHLSVFDADSGGEC